MVNKIFIIYWMVQVKQQLPTWSFRLPLRTMRVANDDMKVKVKMEKKQRRRAESKSSASASNFRFDTSNAHFTVITVL